MGDTIPLGDPRHDEFVEFKYFLHDDEILALWRGDGKRVIDAWIADYPGSRPDFWWRFDAPEPRRRLGGIGMPSWEALSVKPNFRRGLPSTWIDDRDVAIFRDGGCGRQPDPDWPGIPKDPTDPPRFESEAAYLDRLGLFLPGERKRLSQVDFEPEVCT
ncbi:hypothetical protein [Rhizobium leguminosarum]